MMSTDKTEPLVTVYMPTYNRVELLQRAVDSVLEQDYTNIELIVVDDNSTDGTHNYLAKMAEEDKRFRYFINKKNSGACVSRNKAIFEAKGEFITGLDDDDYFLPNRISSFIGSWKDKNNLCIALYSNALIQTKGKPGKTRKPKYCNYHDLLCANWIGNQLFTKTEFLKDIGGFDPQLQAWQDLECWYRLLKYYKKKAVLIDNHSYVLDISHAHERISDKKVSYITKSYQYLCHKHWLSRYEAKVLEAQLSPYLKEYVPLRNLFSIVKYSSSILHAKALVTLYITPRLKRLY